jgi:hypothetical protein
VEDVVSPGGVERVQEVAHAPAVYPYRCVVCGFAICAKEIGGHVGGTYTDFIDNLIGEVNFNFCTDCFSSMKAHSVEAPGVALARRRRLDRDTQEQAQKIKEYREDKVDKEAHND